MVYTEMEVEEVGVDDLAEVTAVEVADIEAEEVIGVAEALEEEVGGGEMLRRAWRLAMLDVLFYLSKAPGVNLVDGNEACNIAQGAEVREMIPNLCQEKKG